MTNDTEFKAWRVQEQDGEYEGSEQTLHVSDLPENDVLIKVSHSSLNYKDALSASGNKGVTRNFPTLLASMLPGKSLKPPLAPFQPATRYW